MVTQKEFIEIQRKELDKKFNEEFPKGKFVIQRVKLLISHSREQLEFGMYWECKRRTASILHKGIGVNCYSYSKISDCSVPSVEDYRNTGYGIVLYRKTLDDIVNLAREKNFSSDLILAFIERYHKNIRYFKEKNNA